MNPIQGVDQTQGTFCKAYMHISMETRPSNLSQIVMKVP
jgi:hypothetical protein